MWPRGASKMLAGGLLVVVAIVAGAWFAWRGLAAPATGAVDSADDQGALSANLHSEPEPLFRLVGGRASKDGSQPIRISRQAAANALRDGVLLIVLPDGSRYLVSMERDETANDGNWTVIGRVQTKLGPQAAVITFGRNAVFGVLPTPDGDNLHIETTPEGTRIVEAGGLAPPGSVVRGPYGDTPFNDVLAQRKVGMPDGDGSRTEPPHIAAASGRERTAPRDARTVPPAPTAAPLVPMLAPVDTTPVRIDVLALYAPDQVTLRGSVAAVQTEFTNLFALANQAHIDSGSRVRLHAIAVQQTDVSTTDNNDTLLQAITFGDMGRSPLEALRNSLGADLVTVLRPHHAGDWSCGVAWLPSGPQAGNQAMSQWGYSVVNVNDVCGPLVFPHELGHSLGSAHDRDTDTRAGVSTHGAYLFSYGLRTPEFATIMAYPEYRPWVAYFSNPGSVLCGAPCGVDNAADNVRSLNLMAPAIAAFRGTPGTLTIPDVEYVEPQYGPRWAFVEVRLTGAAPADGITLQLEAIGGTATQGVDYAFSQGTTMQIPEGTSTASFSFELLPDTVAEPDETIELQVTAPAGVTVADAVGVVTLRSAPRVTLSGKLWWPVDATRPTTPITMLVENFDGPGVAADFVLSPPEYAYAFSVPYGTQLRMTPRLPAPFVLGTSVVNEARQTRQWLLFPEKGVRVTGTVSAAPGMTLPPDTFGLNLVEYIRGVGGDEHTLWVSPPDHTFTQYVHRGRDVTIEFNDPFNAGGNPEPFKRYRVSDWNIGQDVHHDIVLSTVPTLRAMHDFRHPQITGGLAVWLDDVAPAGGVSFRCRTADGTAKAGQDYVAFSATATADAGIRGPIWCGDLVMLPDEDRRQESFELIVDQASGAVLTTPRAQIISAATGPPPRTGGPSPATQK